MMIIIINWLLHTKNKKEVLQVTLLNHPTEAY